MKTYETNNQIFDDIRIFFAKHLMRRMLIPPLSQEFFSILSSLDLLGSGLQLRSYFPPFWRRHTHTHTHTHALVWVGIERPRHWMVSYCCVLKYSKKLQNHVGLTHPSASSPLNLSSATNKATEVASATDVLHKASCLPHVQGMPNEMRPSQRRSDGL